MSSRIEEPDNGQTYKLADVRVALKYDVKSLAQVANVSPQYILRLESGQAKYRTDRIKARRIAKALGVSMESIDWPNGLTSDPSVDVHTKVDPRVSRRGTITGGVCDFGHIQPLRRDPNKGCELCRSEDSL